MIEGVGEGGRESVSEFQPFAKRREPRCLQRAAGLRNVGNSLGKTAHITDLKQFRT